MSEVRVGQVTHYFGRLGVAILEITEGELNVGETVHIVGHKTNITQPIESMQLEHAEIEHACVGQSLGIKIKAHAREHDAVFKVVPGKSS